MNGVITAIDSILKVTDATLMDFYHPFIDSINLYYDDVHPNLAGAKYMTELVLAKLLETDLVHKVETGYPFVKSFVSSNSQAAAFDSITLSWTTINADNVLLDGEVLPANGSKKVTYSENTSYSLVAINEKGADTLVIDQEFYIAEVNKITIYPSLRSMTAGDSLLLQIRYYDQFYKLMQKNSTAVFWEIKTGAGALVNITNSTVILVCTSEGEITVGASIGDISATAKVKVAPKTDFQQKTLLKGITIFPNPIGENINITCECFLDTPVKVRLYNISGQLLVEKEFKSTDITNQLVVFDTGNISEGIYIVEVEVDDKFFKRKITK